MNIDLNTFEIGQREFIAKESWNSGCESRKVYDISQKIHADTGKGFEIEMDHVDGKVFNIYIKRTK